MDTSAIAFAEAAFAAADSTGKFIQWKPSQLEAFDKWQTRENQRMLVYYPTGEGKTKVALTLQLMAGNTNIVVVAPPGTKQDWMDDAKALGQGLLFMSHQKFRLPKTKLPRGASIIIDEFHMLGGHSGNGFTKLQRMSQAFKSVVLCSATPNYNDAERVYCAGLIMDPINYVGGFLNWVNNNCITKPNFFAIMPIVEGFKDYKNAADFLASQPFTAYIEDKAKWTPQRWVIPSPVDLSPLSLYGYSFRKHRIMASDMERRHHEKRLIKLEDNERFVLTEIFQVLLKKMNDQPATTKWLLFSEDKVIAKALHNSFMEQSSYLSTLITGDSTPLSVERVKQIFIHFDGPAVLVGTAALATGINGIDTACDHLIIFDDTNDATKRRQLIGRVLPRGDYIRDTIVTTVDTIPFAI